MTPPSDDDARGAHSRIDALERLINESIRPRIHNQNDLLQAQILKQQENGIRIGLLVTDLDHIRANSATREQLDAGLALLAVRLGGEQKETNIRLDGLRDDLKPIRQAMYWAVALILGTVVLAGLGLLLGRTPYDRAQTLQQLGKP